MKTCYFVWNLSIFNLFLRFRQIRVAFSEDMNFIKILFPDPFLSLSGIQDSHISWHPFRTIARHLHYATYFQQDLFLRFLSMFEAF
jgi:hypothetical protein